MKPLQKALGLVVALAGCIPPAPELELTPVFVGAASAEEYAPYRVAGTAAITGSVVLMQGVGPRSRSAGLRVVLDPATSFAHRWYAEVGLVPDQFDATPSDTIFLSLRRTAVTDTSGAFAFRALPAGSYIVATLDTWDIPNGRFGLRPQTGVASQLVALTSGQSVHVEFSPRAAGADKH